MLSPQRALKLLLSHTFLNAGLSSYVPSSDPSLSVIQFVFRRAGPQNGGHLMRQELKGGANGVERR